MYDLSISGLTIGRAPARYAYSLVKTGGPGGWDVAILVSTNQWWNGSTTSSGGTAVVGNTGTWDAAAGTTNWTDYTGAVAAAYAQNVYATFAGAAGTVTVSGSTAPQVPGMEFLTSGYTITGGGITLAGIHGETIARLFVEDSAVTGGGTATVASALSGSMGSKRPVLARSFSPVPTPIPAIPPFLEAPCRSATAGPAARSAAMPSSAAIWSSTARTRSPTLASSPVAGPWSRRAPER